MSIVYLDNEKGMVKSLIARISASFFLGIGRVPTVSRCVLNMSIIFQKIKKWLGHLCNQVQCVSSVPYMLDMGTATQIPYPCFVDYIKQRMRSRKYLCR